MRASTRIVPLAAAALLALSAPALAQQTQPQGNNWGGALDQLNRAVNPDSYQQNRIEQERRERERDRRYEGSSGTSSRQERGGAFASYSDRDLRGRLDSVIEEQSQLRDDRRALEAEMQRRGIRR